jgi:hypothetical protein
MLVAPNGLCYTGSTLPWQPSRPLPDCQTRKKSIGTQAQDTKIVAAGSTRSQYRQVYQHFSKRSPQKLSTTSFGAYTYPRTYGLHKSQVPGLGEPE